MRTLNTNLNQNQSSSFFELSQGLDVDQYLVTEELQVQLAWAQELSNKNYLSKSEVDSIFNALNYFKEEVQSGKYKWDPVDEDIHMAIEKYVTEKAGDAGKKMHLGRSRNDLIATTLRLFVSNQIEIIKHKLKDFCHNLLKQSERDISLVIPAQTHRQAAQPMLAAHWWNANAVNFCDDIKRFDFAKKSALSQMPIGAGAVAGTHLNIDLNKLASTLGFTSPSFNSLQVTSDRDFAIDFGYAVSMLGIHFTRFCEEIIYWSSTPVGMLKLPPDWSSGSSMMPNKRNPDAFEILRAKSKRLISKHQELVLNNTSLPLGYASDLHEQKRTLLTMIHEANLILNSMTKAILGLEFDSQRCLELINGGHILATDFANQLVAEGMSFREAYKKTAEEITKLDIQKKQIAVDKIQFFSALELRNSPGGTAKKQITETIQKLKESIQ